MICGTWSAQMKTSGHPMMTSTRAGGLCYEAAGSFEDSDAGAFGAHQRAGDVEAVFRQEVVQVVSGNASRDIRKLAADLIAVTIGEFLEAGVDLGAAAAFADDAVEIFVAGGADVQALSVVGEDFERLDIVVGFPGHDGVDAAGVVADHPTESAAVVGCRIRRKREVMLLGFGAQVVEDDTGLDAGDAVLGIDLENFGHVFREVEDDGDVATLAGEGGSAAASQDRRVVFAAERDGGEHIFFIAREDDADRDLAVVGAVRRIEGAAAGVETDVSTKMAAEGGFES